ncbi:MAG: hypothetical protein ACD_16C00061G0001 [uncultured bacterium]|nr:MAG: hypothetical protein ACD_16C00061G0001 [uncultured bacterium]OFW69740.1 MAG: hypothetical protein A2X70_01625 [Alphaproteobacteria bacterium GWC2_42_16]OFW74322.1 MAG: hypothetical protein A2Z80_04405 [Alphaproteobacteria bacterium GWA2_41_27]OFW84549.1 MAG: hypothetical protein A3E50_07870 [Alphaproteobacteria bacterium RIFCSPHIGHO2_12_FULL_42_100]OFW85526.1 MAG: hypothetical protein A2W06_02080 [Alphaproteobacteria bacterium RBG_16_42_14]OFW91379.1 MAG: hypothetical protein A2W46_028
MMIKILHLLLVSFFLLSSPFHCELLAMEDGNLTRATPAKRKREDVPSGQQQTASPPHQSSSLGRQNLETDPQLSSSDPTTKYTTSGGYVSPSSFETKQLKLISV